MTTHVLPALALFGLIACSSIEPYQGPPSDTPSIAFSARMGRRVVTLANPTDNTLTFRIDCDQTLIDPLTLPARSSSTFLISPGDTTCRAFWRHQ